jgi:hypothetical protein
LGISRATIYSKINRYGINLDKYRNWNHYVSLWYMTIVTCVIMIFFCSILSQILPNLSQLITLNYWHIFCLFL